MRRTLSLLALFMVLLAAFSGTASASDPTANNFNQAGHEHEGGHDWGDGGRSGNN